MTKKKGEAIRIFLSAGSGQFVNVRERVARELRMRGYAVTLQEEMGLSGMTLLENLKRLVEECDCVVALIGDAYGAEPEPATVPRRSYSQWEYAFGRGTRLNGEDAAAKRIFPFLAGKDYLEKHPVDESEEKQELQREFLRELKASNQHYGQFANEEELLRKVHGCKFEGGRRGLNGCAVNISIVVALLATAALVTQVLMKRGGENTPHAGTEPTNAAIDIRGAMTNGASETKATPSEQRVSELKQEVSPGLRASWETLREMNPTTLDRVMEKGGKLGEEMSSIKDSELNLGHLIDRDQYAGYAYFMAADAAHRLKKVKERDELIDRGEERLTKGLEWILLARERLRFEPTKRYYIQLDRDIAEYYDEARTRYLLVMLYALDVDGRKKHSKEEVLEQLNKIPLTHLQYLEVSPKTTPYLEKLVN